MTSTDRIYLELRYLQNDFGPIKINLKEFCKRLRRKETKLMDALFRLQSYGKIKFQTTGRVTLIDFM
jgi:hypothetical protein